MNLFYTREVTPLLTDLDVRAHENWAKIQDQFSSAKTTNYKFLIGTWRAHDNWVLQWVQQQGFDRLFTDFASFSHKQQMSAAPATLAKVGIQEAKQTWIEL